MKISNWIETWADHSPDKIAIRYNDDEISYSEFARRVSICARMLKHTLRVGRGDRIAYLDKNNPELFYFLFACARLGVILIPLNWRLAALEHLYELQHAGASALIVNPEFSATITAVQSAALPCRCILNENASIPQCMRLEALLDSSDGDDDNPAVNLDNPLLIVYTSGTMGRPKGATLRQSALFWNAINSQAMHGMTSADHILTSLPLFHVGGLNIQTTPAFHCGATVTVHRAFDPTRVLQEIQQSHPTLTVLVPAQMSALLELPNWQSADLSSLRSLTTGSTIVPQRLIKAWRERLVPVLQVYGLTETCPIATYQTVENMGENYATIGKQALHCHIRVVDDHCIDVATGSSGELLVRGPNVMEGYWGDSQATQAAFDDDWFHTGDVGYCDKDGFFYIADRKRDVIFSGGENIYPAELESILHEHPDIKEAAVVERKDEKWGEVPVAIISLKSGKALTKAQVLALFEGRIGRYKYPKDVVFTCALPRNAMGKVQKQKLREMLAGALA